MKNELTILIQLSEVDSHISQLQEAKTKLPAIIQDIQNKISQVENLIQGIEAEIASLHTQKSASQNIIQEKQDWIQKREAVINEIKTTREYQASIKEIASAKKEILDQQNKIQALDETEKDIQKKLEDTQNTYLPKVEELKNKEKECQEKSESIEPRVQAEQSKRKDIISKLEQKILRQYETIQRKLNPALACADTRVCSECGTRIPPQAYNHLHAAESLQNCIGCRRILYLSSHIEGESNAPENEA